MSILAIAAHPDDIESWCAGTLARSVDAGAQVRLLLVTSGDKGTSDPVADSSHVAAQREQEALQAAAELGLVEVDFLRHPDGEVEDTRLLRGQFVAAIRRWKPQVVFTHDPEHPYPPYFSHRDHRIVGRTALDAVYPLARDRLSFSEQAAEGLTPHNVREVWLFASTAAVSYVDISSTFDRKIAARLAHRSQTSDPDSLRENWSARAQSTGSAVGLELAEAFTILRLE
ncbi:MAG: PIG-L family deacetylase [Chloroflexota bacterium]|nr:PIG-L family deacetylase [Chloroflexota bacterium]